MTDFDPLLQVADLVGHSLLRRRPELTADERRYFVRAAMACAVGQVGIAQHALSRVVPVDDALVDEILGVERARARAAAHEAVQSLAVGGKDPS